jgi:hypothetical protein
MLRLTEVLALQMAEPPSIVLPAAAPGYSAARPGWR